MLRGVLLGFGTYFLYSLSDACLKASGGRLNVVQIIFVATLFSCIVLLFSKPKTEQWIDMVRMRHPVLLCVRVVMAICCGIFGAYAFTTLPLAETYALLFLMPVFVAALSVLVLGERLGWAGLLAVLIGLGGILLVVRPGFRELQLGHLAGIANALCAAVSLLILRKIGRTERRIAMLGTLIIGMLVFTGAATIFLYVPPTPREWLLLALCGIFGGIGQLGLMAATRNAPANRVGPIQYSQMIWAVILGALFFSEYPDWISVCGIALVCMSGLFVFLRDDPAHRPTG